MSELIFLGTGGFVPTPFRDNTAIVLTAGGNSILVECPGSVVAKLGKLGLDYRRIPQILLTHIHPDHIYGLPSFVHCLMLEEGEIQVWGSEETVTFSRRLLDLFGLRGKKIKTRVRFRILRPGKEMQLEKSLSVRAIRVPHESSSLAFHISIHEEGKEVLISGDTPLYPPLFKEARGIDYLIHECSAPARFFKKYPGLSILHTSSLQLGKWSQKAEVRCLLPCHFLGEILFSPEEVRREIRRHYKRRLIIPRDYQRIRL